MLIFMLNFILFRLAPAVHDSNPEPVSRQHWRGSAARRSASRCVFAVIWRLCDVCVAPEVFRVNILNIYIKFYMFLLFQCSTAQVIDMEPLLMSVCESMNLKPAMFVQL